MAALASLWNRGATWTDLLLLAVLYVVSMAGITVGFHRLLTHRSFATSRALETTFAVAGSLAVQGPVINWVADHRRHHAFADRPGDPHSPHVRHDVPIGWVSGLIHAHLGWMLAGGAGQSDPKVYARDLLESRHIRTVHRLFPLIAVAGVLLPGAAVGLAHRSTAAAIEAVLWGGLVRIFLVHHVTWSINSLCHLSGRARFVVDDESRNVPVLAALSLGESWHNNHHAFPRSARHGLGRRELDPAGSLISLLARVGLAWNVIEISEESVNARARTQSHG
jgi:stearoyl-CoA desaturase (delta-9 desaturase)